jgi:voltage-gated potassium channel
VESVFFIALRRLRAPLILIILVFTVATVGLTLIPGVDPEGKPWRMTPFQAFYFVTYTATTIGFGEVPHPFTDVQRLWVTLIIYLSVIGWAFLLGSVLGLSQDNGFRQSLQTARFRHAVRALREPFYLVCGLGETGLMVVQALDRLGRRCVVLDRDEGRLGELQLLGLGADVPALDTDARVPENLMLAGLKKDECRGVLALSSDEEANLAIAINTRLLHPGLPAICRAFTPGISASMAVVGTYQTINPFVQFGEQLRHAMTAPDRHRLLAWLTGPPGTYLAPAIPVPPGHWIVCGYGRFGEQIVPAIRHGGFDVTIIDPVEDEPAEEAVEAHVRKVRGRGADAETLMAAGIGDASGIVAGTDNDTANLAIAIAALRLNPNLFVIVRQNVVANGPLFDALGADMTMVSSQIVANECVAILRTPLLADFLGIVRRREERWATELVERLRALTGESTPDFWSFEVSTTDAPGLHGLLQRSPEPVTVGDLRRSVLDRERRTSSIGLLLIRGEERWDLPDDEMTVRQGDRLLFAGTQAARREQREAVRNANMAAHVIAGRSSLEGIVWRWLNRSGR